MKPELEPINQPTPHDIGRKIKSLRVQRDWTLNQLASESGLSASFLSQVERGLRNTTLEALRRIAVALSVPLFQFVLNEESDLRVVRGSRRKSVQLPDRNVAYELLTPNLHVKLQMVLIRLPQGAATFDEPYSHHGEECNLVLSGRVKFQVGEHEQILDEGDSIYIDSTVPHRFVNVGDGPAVILSSLTPPTF